MNFPSVQGRILRYIFKTLDPTGYQSNMVQLFKSLENILLYVSTLINPFMSYGGKNSGKNWECDTSTEQLVDDEQICEVLEQSWKSGLFWQLKESVQHRLVAWYLWHKGNNNELNGILEQDVSAYQENLKSHREDDALSH